MDDDVQRVAAEITLDAPDHSVYTEVAGVLVALVGADVFGRVGEGVERGVEWIDLLELQQLSVGQPSRLVHLSALDQIHEDVERRRPGSDRDAGPRFSE